MDIPVRHGAASARPRDEIDYTSGSPHDHCLCQARCEWNIHQPIAGRSVPHFALMANREHRYGIPFQSIQHKVTAVSEINEPLSKFKVKILTWPAQFSVLRKNLRPAANCVHRASRSVDIFQGKRTVKTLDVRQ